LKVSVVDTGYTGAIGMPRCDPNIKLALAQMLNDASSEETGPAENSDNVSLIHLLAQAGTKSSRSDLVIRSARGFDCARP
jgi:hypothetical protein